MIKEIKFFLARLRKRKTRVNIMRNKREAGKANDTEIQRILRDYWEHLHTNNLQEMDQFLETQTHQD